MSDSRLSHNELDTLANRLWTLAASGSSEADGLTQLAVGVQAFVEERDQDWVLEYGEELGRILTDLVELIAESGVSKVQVPGRQRRDTTPGGLEAFLERFRAEAKKRLAGLSISLVGVFNEEGAEQAIEQSTTHLHAIRGGAAMLGLKEIAELSGVMEDVIVAQKKMVEVDRVWPVKPLLRGFAVLRTAIEDPEEPELELAQREATQALRDVLGQQPMFAAARRQRPGRNEHETPTIQVPIETGFEREKSVTDVSTRKLEQRILIVDDVETIAASVGLILSELDIPVDVALDANEALNQLREVPYSLVISDIQMPGMSGLELTRILRADEATADIPVILLTGLDKDEEREAGMDAGADDYIVKGSIGGGELVKRVMEFLADAPYVPALSAEEEPRHNRILVVEDTETVAASIAFVLSEGTFDIVLAHDGEDALHRLEQDVYDLILSDVEMPSINGLELTRRLREDSRWSGLPIILLTARDSGSTEAQAEEAGADLYLVKGEVGGGRLLEIVEDYLAKGSHDG
jgi:DNA-binding response OmpR family regulator/HPt (histidine-containing phosphotransfer) domain-containing protein